MSKNSIEIIDISKSFKLKGDKRKVLALDHINLLVNEGDVFGLIGPNGAGKTTLIKILTTLIKPTSGFALINGHNIINESKLIKNQISLMLSAKMLYYRATGYDNLKFFCKIYNVKNYKEKINEKVKEFGLENWLNEYLSNYSSGMRTKLALCKIFLLNRSIIFLDEPTVALDRESITFLVNKIKELKSTIFIATHDFNFVKEVCNRVAYIKKGNILKIGNLDIVDDYIKSYYSIKKVL